MNKTVLAAIAALLSLYVSAQESRTVYNFLRLPVSAHVAALGGDNISIADDDASMIFHHPALINNVSDRTINLNAMTYMKGSATASAAFVKAVGERGTWGVFGQFMSFGTMKETDIYGQQTGEFSAKDVAIGGTFAYGLSEKISGGVTAKLISSYIGNYSSLAAGVDLGLNYYNDENDFSLSIVARNLGGQLSAYEDDFERMPLDLQAGFTKRLLRSPLRLSLTLVRLNDWEYGIGKHIVVGADLLLTSQFYVSAGYNAMRASEMKISADDGSSAHGAGLSIGGGLQLQRLKINAAYAKYHVSSTSLLLNRSYTL